MCSRVLVPFHNHGLGNWGFEPINRFRSPRSRLSNSLSLFDDDSIFDVDYRLDEIKRRMNFGTLSRLNRDSFGLDTLDGEIVTEGSERKFKLSVPIGDFPPEDVKICLKDWIMSIEAKTEQKSEDGTSRSYKEVSRKFTLPRNLDMKEVSSILTADGVLKIEAPLPQKPLPAPRRDQDIPILRA